MLEIKKDPIANTYTLSRISDENGKETQEQLIKTIASPLESYHKLPREKQFQARNFAKSDRQPRGDMRSYFDFNTGNIKLVPLSEPITEHERIQNEKMTVLRKTSKNS